ncbi:MAG: acetyl-CoA synthase subunit gamma [Bacteroidia bacterium]|nr:MAG: acetyl-CoA synthase subunit gamma [Bacteroidia bacterium]
MENGFSPVRTPVASPAWTHSDWLGALRVRLSIGRNSYSVNPGLYRMGTPGDKSDVFVSANYKLSFDILRRNLAGINCWILVLDTSGINIWCAAGKGTFGSDELIRQVKESFLERVVSHRRIIVPQLGAPGISSHLVLRETGFRIKYGPVMAKDIRQYVKNGYKKDEQMYRVRFNLVDRLILTPVEMAGSLKRFLVMLVLFVLISGIGKGGYSPGNLVDQGLIAAFMLGAAWLTGAFITPVMLPWIPTRPFSAKGIIAGSVIMAAAWLLLPLDFPILAASGLAATGIAISSFLAMNFTGASTYASPSGVKKEMKQYIPVQLILAGAGIILFVVSNITEIR